MGNSQIMPKVDFQKENLKGPYIYSKLLEARNLERYKLVSPLIRRQRIILTSALLAVCGIYSLTIFKIKQETFLDDFEEPELVKK